MQIFGPYRVTPPQPTSVSRTNSVPGNQTKPSSSQPIDQLDLSSEAESINRLAAGGESSTVEGIRFEKVADLRRQIAEGSYDTPDKLDAALDRLLDQIG